MLTSIQIAGLYHELHKAIDESSKSLSDLKTDDLTYPPGIELTEEEAASLKELDLSPAAKSALYKLSRNASSWPLFHFFCLIDAVVEPSGKAAIGWHGADLIQKSKERNNMMHDDFYASYWKYSD